MSAATSSIRADARRLEILAGVIAGVIGLGLVLRFIVLPLSVAARAPGGVEMRELLQLVGEHLILALPSILFLGALTAARKVCVRLREGELFGTAVGKGVADMGSSLLWGAAALAVIVPTLLAWVRSDPGGLGLDLETETMVIGFVGVTMLLLGRVLTRAGAVKDELERFV